MCVSYSATLRLMDELSKHHIVPLEKWIEEGVVFKFWGDNVDKQRKVRDLRSDNRGQLIHMFSLVVGRSRTPAPELLHSGGDLSALDRLSSSFVLPSKMDVNAVRDNLVSIVSRIITSYITGLAPLAKFVPKHILHQYSREMSMKSEVFTLDILMKNEAKHDDMIDIMRTLQDYLGKDYNEERRVLCGGDQLTCERQVGAQRLTRCADSLTECLQLLEPVSEDWHCLVSFLRVSSTSTHTQRIISCKYFVHIGSMEASLRKIII